MKRPVMTWTGQDYKDSHATVAPNSGEVYVWTHQGRAIVAGGVGSFPQANGRSVFHEFHVLTDLAPLRTVCTVNSSEVWNPTGVTPLPIPGAPQPFDSSLQEQARARRLIQMRRLAREFSGGCKKPAGPGNVRLKLAATPLYRLDGEELQKGQYNNIIDGALFVFTGELGTDPEILLYIECRRNDDELLWTYVPAAFTYVEMWMDHKGRRVWHIPSFLVDKLEENYFSALVEHIATLDDVRQRLEQ
jgi:hypothetical protein